MNIEKSFESHNISIADRRHTELTGIDDVLGFDETMIVVHSAMGDLTIEGEELKIDSFSSDRGSLSVSGKISGLYYLEQSSKRQSRKKNSSR